MHALFKAPVALPALMLAALIVAGGGALAQTTTPPAATAPATDVTKPTLPAVIAHGAPVGGNIQQHIETLHRRLRITTAQEAQWQTFAQTMRDNAAHMDALFKARGDAADANAVDDLRSYAAIAQAHADDMQKLVPAFQALYAAMTPVQQKAADVAFQDFEHRRMLRPGHG